MSETNRKQIEQLLPLHEQVKELDRQLFLLEIRLEREADWNTIELTYAKVKQACKKLVDTGSPIFETLVDAKRGIET